MEIFDAEKDIAEKINSNNSIAYSCTIEKVATAPDIEYKGPEYFEQARIEVIAELSDIDDVVRASIQDKQLYYHEAILVTTNKNKNDDVFLPSIVWAAKDTPVDKPTNIGHDSTKVIGHMTSSRAIDTDGKAIANDTEFKDLPSKFHILVGAVIYKIWPSSDEYAENVNELIKQIEAGEKYVSMECTFDSFDYFLQNDKEQKIIARNNDTAFLTKYLRAYGGEGNYKDYKIGRAIKNISFCGKGYVDKPANPESIIFTKNDISDFSSAKYSEKLEINENCGVISEDNKILLAEKSIMTEFYKEQVDELKATVATLTSSLETMKEKMTQSNVEKLEKQIESLTAQITDMTEVLAKKSDEITIKTTEVADLNTKLVDITKANDELTKSHKELTDKFTTIEAEKLIVARVSTLVSGGFSKEEAQTKVDAYKSVADEVFTILANDLIEGKKNANKNPENPGEATAEDLEDVEKTDPDVTSASAEDKTFDITELAGKLSAAFKTKDGEKK